VNVSFCKPLPEPWFATYSEYIQPSSCRLVVGLFLDSGREREIEERVESGNKYIKWCYCFLKSSGSVKCPHEAVGRFSIAITAASPRHTTLKNGETRGEVALCPSCLLPSRKESANETPLSI
jgi:hypothetical protein